MQLRKLRLYLTHTLCIIVIIPGLYMDCTCIFYFTYTYTYTCTKYIYMYTFTVLHTLPWCITYTYQNIYVRHPNLPCSMPSPSIATGGYTASLASFLVVEGRLGSPVPRLWFAWLLVTGGYIFLSVGGFNGDLKWDFMVFHVDIHVYIHIQYIYIYCICNIILYCICTYLYMSHINIYCVYIYCICIYIYIHTV